MFYTSISLTDFLYISLMGHIYFNILSGSGISDNGWQVYEVDGEAVNLGER